MRDYIYEVLDFPPALQSGYAAALECAEVAPGLLEGMVKAHDREDALDRIAQAVETACLPPSYNICIEELAHVG